MQSLLHEYATRICYVPNHMSVFTVDRTEASPLELVKYDVAFLSLAV